MPRLLRPSSPQTLAAGLFAAWTASGVVTMVLCAALSVRVHSLVVRPGQPGNLISRMWRFLHGVLTGD